MISITQRNEDFDISGDQETKVYKLAQFIIDYTGSSSKIRVCSPEKEQPQKVRLDISKLRSLGYKPKVSIEEGMVKTIGWYKEYLS